MKVHTKVSGKEVSHYYFNDVTLLLKCLHGKKERQILVSFERTYFKDGPKVMKITLNSFLL